MNPIEEAMGAVIPKLKQYILDTPEDIDPVVMLGYDIFMTDKRTEELIAIHTLNATQAQEDNKLYYPEPIRFRIQRWYNLLVGKAKRNPLTFDH